MVEHLSSMNDYLLIITSALWSCVDNPYVLFSFLLVVVALLNKRPVVAAGYFVICCVFILVINWRIT